MNRGSVDKLTHWTLIAKWLGAAVLLGASGVVVVRTFTGSSAEQSQSTGPVATAEVSRVYSGHKVKLESDRHLTYAGIRCPYNGEALFEDAKQRNAELVEGKKIRLRFDPEEPTDSETLHGYVFAEGEFVNELLVSEGLAYVRLTTANRRFAKELLDAQHTARRKRRGLWRETEPARESVYVADPKYGNFHRPDCKHVPNIKQERRVEFRARRVAFDQGFAPCDKCKP